MAEERGPATCLRCGGSMRPGAIRDLYEAGLSTSQEWVADPRPGWKGRERREVVTHRCTACGFLESYGTRAIETPEPPLADWAR